MTSTVLARKWRPKRFSELVGQTHVVEALTHALAQQRLHHAYLFAGTRGVGKTTLGRIFAKALNCEQGITPEPCGECAACRAIDAGRFVDLIEIDAASRTKVEDTREILDNVQYAPSEGRFKIYLIDEVHMLSNSSFNALLKTLEEPPEHVKFILATTDPHKLPVTVLSRCLKLNLLRIQPAEIEAHLRRIVEAEGVPAEDTALHLIAYHADGSVRDALSLLDQAIAQGGGQVTEAGVRTMLGLTDETLLRALLTALADDDPEALADQFDQLAQRGMDYAQVLETLLRALHQIALVQQLGRTPLDTPDTLGRDFASRFSPDQVQMHYEIGLLGQKTLDVAPDTRTAFEMALLRMLAFEPLTQPEAMQKAPQQAQIAPAEAGAKNAPAKKSGTPLGDQADNAVSPAAVQSADQLDTAPLVQHDAPGGEDALSGDDKQSRFASLKARLAHGKGVSPGKPEPPPAADTLPQNASAEAHDTRAPTPPPETVAATVDRTTPSAETSIQWLDAAQWRDILTPLGVQGLVRELAWQCVVARSGDSLLLAVAGDHEHLLAQKGDELLAMLQQAGIEAEFTEVIPPADSLTLAQADAQREVQRQAQAREAFLQDPNVQRIQQLFDARIIDASIKPIE